jgi:hypothetical protein
MSDLIISKTLFAYNIESLMPLSLQTANTSHSPQKINGSTDVQFFSVGSLGGRTLVIYMIKKGVGYHPIVSGLADFTWSPVGQCLPRTRAYFCRNQ